VCQLDALARCRNRATLRKSLATLPQTLDQTYDRILTAISKEDYEYAMRILQWLTFAARPLSVKEVAEVVAIDVARDPAFNCDEVLEDPLEALNICSSLITVTTTKVERSSSPPQQILALAHYSVQEYLTSERIKQGLAKQYSMQEVICHSAITKGCLMYLLQFQQPLSAEVFEASALARYAAEFWRRHLRDTGDKTEESLLAMSLMSADSPAYLNWIRLCDPDFPKARPWLGELRIRCPTPLYYAARLGLCTVTKLLLDKSAEVNAQGGHYGNALQAASFGGHEQVVKMLLDNRADVNAQGGKYTNALYAASYEGHEQVVKMLLDNKADVNAHGGKYANALQAASYRGHEQVVKILLDNKADVNAHGGSYVNALYAASFEGHEQVVKMLLEHYTNVRVLLKANKSKLKDASDQTTRNDLTLERVKLLVQDGHYERAVNRAWSNGYVQIVVMMLETDPTSSALYKASKRGYREVVKLLLDKGVDVNAQGGHYGNALQAASFRGHKQVVKLLLEAGAHQPKENTVIAGLK
jgi:ankyrin repeat protein